MAIDRAYFRAASVTEYGITQAGGAALERYWKTLEIIRQTDATLGSERTSTAGT